MSDVLINFFSELVWPIFWLIAIASFWPAINAILLTIKKRMETDNFTVTVGDNSVSFEAVEKATTQLKNISEKAKAAKTSAEKEKLQLEATKQVFLAEFNSVQFKNALKDFNQVDKNLLKKLEDQVEKTRDERHNLIKTIFEL